MKLEKAIEILAEMVKYQYSSGKTDEGDAVKLGLDALNRIKSLRSIFQVEEHHLLSGETPDGDSP